MLSGKYADWLRVRRGYVAVFSRELDRQEKEAWKGFIPHEHMENLLDLFLRALERQNQDDRRPLWIYGPYGTGKTHACFVLKHLLEDPLDEVESYWNGLGRELGQDRRARLLGLRERGRYVVVYNYGSATIDTATKFLIELQLSLQRELRERGLKLAEGRSQLLREQLLEKLQPGGTIDWQAVFKKYRTRLLQYPGAASVLAELERGGDGELFLRVLEALTDEGVAISTSPEGTVQWVKEVIEANGLAGLVVLWDEFTDFFTHRVPTSGLQALAEASRETCFYHCIVTHRSPDWVRHSTAEDWKKLMDRFHTCHYQLQAPTGFKLMARAIELLPERGVEWQQKRHLLWERVSSVGEFVDDVDQSISRAELEQLLPMHPYTALVATQIANRFSSSQRTIFGLLESSSAGSFRQFLESHPKDGWELYTLDHLWDYFFEPGARELAEDMKAEDVLAHYRLLRDSLSGAEQRVAKAALLLLALEKAASDISRDVQPTLSNLRKAYAGTPIAGQLEQIVERLEEQGALHSMPFSFGRDKHLFLPQVYLDRASVDEEKKKLVFESFFRDEQYEVVKRVRGIVTGQVSDLLGRRVRVNAAPFADLRARHEGILPSCQPHQVALAVVVAQKEQELPDAREQAQRLAARLEPHQVLLVLDCPFGEERWDKFAEDLARGKVCERIHDQRNAQFHQRRAERLLDEWKEEAQRSPVYVFRAAGSERLSDFAAGFGPLLERLVEELFPYRTEKFYATATVYDEKQAKVGAQIGLGEKEPTSNYVPLVEELKKLGFWHAPDKARQQNPDHPVSKMFELVERLFNEEKGATSLLELWQQLQARPFGMWPCQASYLLMGLLLRDRCEGYFYRDGTTSYPLNRTKMAELIHEVISKQKGRELVRHTPEQEALCRFLREAFGLGEEQQYLEQAVDAARQRLRAIGFPFWTLYWVGGQGGATSVQDSLSAAAGAVAEFLRLRPEERSHNQVKRLIDILQAAGEWPRPAKIRLDRDRLEEGMCRFLKDAEPNALPAAAQLGVGPSGIIELLRQELNEEVYLWRPESVRARLPEITGELELILALRKLTEEEKLTTLEQALGALRTELKRCNLPLWAFAEVTEEDDVRSNLRDLSRLLDDGREFQGKRQLAQRLESQMPKIKGVLRSNVAATVARWARKQGLDIDPAEESDLWGQLSDLSDVKQPHVAVQRISQALEEVRGRQVRRKVLERWRSITRSDSPAQWEKDHKVPLRWLLEGYEINRLLLLLDGASGSKDEWEDAQRTLDQIEPMLRKLEEPAWLGARLLSYLAVAPSLLERLALRTAELREELRRELGPEPREWMSEKARNLAKNWAAAQYKSVLLPEVKEKIKGIPAEQVRVILERAAEDPAAGEVIVALVESYVGRQVQLEGQDSESRKRRRWPF